MKRILLFFALIIVLPSFAQIEEEIMQSKAQKIAKGREYLLEKFLDRDYEKVKEIKDYLLTLEDDDYVALTPYELWHILAWTKEFDALTTELKKVNSTFFVSFENKIFPENDMLFNKLYLKGCEDEHLIRFSIQDAQLQPEDEAAVSLVFDGLLQKQKSEEEQDKLNEKSDRFLKDYPDSDYEWFVRHLIRVNIVEKGFGWGMGFGACSAVATGVLQKPIIGMFFDVDLYYNKLDFCFSFNALYSQTREDQFYGNYGSIYGKGKECDYLSIDLYSAYPVYEGKTVKISPFIGVGFMEEYYAWAKDTQLKSLIKHFGVGHVGAFFDITLPDKSFLRFKYDFGMTGLQYNQFSQMHRVSIGWNISVRKQNRVY